MFYRHRTLYTIISGIPHDKEWEWITDCTLPTYCSSMRCMTPTSKINAVQVRSILDTKPYLIPLCQSCVKRHRSSRNGIPMFTGTITAPL